MKPGIQPGEEDVERYLEMLLVQVSMARLYDEVVQHPRIRLLPDVVADR